MEDDKFTPYEQRLTQLWERMVRAIGIHTVNVLIERAIYQASERHPQLSLIERTDEGLGFGELEKACAEAPEQEIANAFTDLTSELLLIMARLLGTEMAQRLAEELEAKMERETPRAEESGT